MMHEPNASSRVRPDGKASFDEIYNHPTPSAYFTALRPLEYMTPGRAQPLVRRCVEALRRRRDLKTVSVLDLCAGYGINGALLKYRVEMRDLYERFAGPSGRPNGAERISDDTAWFNARRRSDADVRVIAQDVAQNALVYGRTVGLCDEFIFANLEESDPTPEQEALLRDVHLVIVTGGLSYIGAVTFRRILWATKRRPWALYFPLRHTDTDEIDDVFEETGYAVETARRAISHRRFRSADERRAIRSRVLDEAAPDEHLPSATHLEALIKLARPEDELVRPPFDEIIAGGRGRVKVGDGAPVRSGAAGRSGH